MSADDPGALKNPALGATGVAPKVLGSINMTRAFYPLMKARGGGAAKTAAEGDVVRFEGQH